MYLELRVSMFHFLAFIFSGQVGLPVNDMCVESLGCINMNQPPRLIWRYHLINRDFDDRLCRNHTANFRSDERATYRIRSVHMNYFLRFSRRFPGESPKIHEKSLAFVNFHIMLSQLYLEFRNQRYTILKLENVGWTVYAVNFSTKDMKF